MSVSGVSAANSTTKTTSGASHATASQDLGQDAFMQLLLAQLRNQDPLEPMKDSDFIAQLAQFNSLNEMTKMSQNIDELVKAQALGQGAALIGKTVRGLGSDGQTLTGVVTGLQISGGNVVLDISGQRMALNKVDTVTDTERSSQNGGQTQSNTSPTTS
ncbi:MAG: hypothetical protein FOGNACKC_03689 [Anaerolineae bacterium]|nr:hypothetical protein [Anaerolineae bacterium]